MKNIILLFLLLVGIQLFAQENKQKLPAVSFNGGLWAGANKTTTFIGFIGPKLSITFSVNTKTKIEAGLNGIPGITLGSNPKLGLSAGATLTIKRENCKLKPIIGVAMIKTDKWQTIYGIGFLF